MKTKTLPNLRIPSGSDDDEAALSSPEYARISHFPLLPSFLPSSSVLSFVPHTPQIPGKGFPDFQIAAQDEERATSSSSIVKREDVKDPDIRRSSSPS